MSENKTLTERLEQWAAEHDLNVDEQNGWKIIDIPSDDGIKRFFNLVMIGGDKYFTGSAFATTGESRKEGRYDRATLCAEQLYNQEPAENFESRLAEGLAYLRNVKRQDMVWRRRGASS